MFLKIYFVGISVFLALDMVWLLFVAREFYNSQIGYLLSKIPNFFASFIFYLIFIAGLTIFVITPALENKIWTQALLMGAFFGLVTYATYDLTNFATIKDWPLVVTIVDLIWGMVLSATVSVVTYFVVVRFWS